MKHVMLDIETLGRDQGCIVLSIGACVFEPLGVGHGETFYQNIDPYDCQRLGLGTDPATVAWWKEQSLESQHQLVINRKPLKDALTDFVKWLDADKFTKIWCQGTSFDIPIMKGAFKAVQMEEPWQFWNTRDTRTIYDMCNFNPKTVKREGTYHNALADAEHQVKCLQMALRK